MNSMGMVALFLIGKNILFDLVSDFSGQKAQAEFTTKLMGYFNMSFLAIYFLTSLGILIILILQSNQIVGPILKITNTLKLLNQDKLQKTDCIRLRKGDFFGELADEVNRLINKYAK